VAKRTGKTHENLENELTPAPTERAPSNVSRTRTAGDAARGRSTRDRSGPISVSGGDFATPTTRKRTTTQPRGLPVVRVPVEPVNNGTPPPVPVAAGAQPEAPFMAPSSAELGDSANRLAAEAAAVRAFDSGPLTPPPEVQAPDPGPTPPPIVSSSPENDVALMPEAAPPPPAVEVHPIASSGTPTPPPVAASARSPEPASAPEAMSALDPVSVPSAEELVQEFAATETPWPQLVGGPPSRAVTPTPGAIPTDAMGGDSGGRSPAPTVTPPPEARVYDGEVAGGEELLVDETPDTGDALETLPPEALAEPEISGPTSAAPTPPPAPRVPSAPPPPPTSPPRRKTGEIKPPEVPTAQVVASLVPELPPGAPPLPEALAQRPRRPKRSKPWFEEVFDEDYLRTLPFMSGEQTLREVEFIEASLAARPGARILDVGCGYGRHAIELVQRGLDVTGLDLSLPLLIRAADEAQKRALSVNFVHADMREMAFDQEFDGVTCMLTSFGYFDEDANMRVAEGMARALKPGGRLLLDIVNRDYIVSDLPSRVWWEGNGCVVLEEVDFNFHTSRILTHRSIVFEDGRQVEQELSIRAYSLHEIGRLLRQAGFRVLDISGALATRGQFFGSTSRSLMILAEKRTEET
jgi:SAM-dependent methyltransferase